MSRSDAHRVAVRCRQHEKVERSDAREERPVQDHAPGVHLVLVRYVCQREAENQCHSDAGCALLDTAETHVCYEENAENTRHAPTVLLPPRAQLCIKCCSNKQTRFVIGSNLIILNNNRDAMLLQYPRPQQPVSSQSE
jgi:hypothetical protein